MSKVKFSNESNINGYEYIDKYREIVILKWLIIIKQTHIGEINS